MTKEFVKRIKELEKVFKKMKNLRLYQKKKIIY